MSHFFFNLQTGNCPTLERSTFDTSKCLWGIYEDLNAYRAELKSFNDQKVMETIDEMMKVSVSVCLLPFCYFSLKPEFAPFYSQSNIFNTPTSSQALKGSSRSMPQPAAGAGLASFKERMKLCSILHAFRIRAFTITRTMNYLTSLESLL
ncbi:interleukin-12 subunit alpha [Falco cherrug]|uniref:interleukin-12 subunit alpha n=1 Tax=Falco cherrug TaxID=345164 RepID=UPI00247A40FD|nr:interleukin-12 subunit alpha [Falco cherrug]XP_055673368.1 interleukin-12 subunit alpha [Falco peregrinus]